MMFPEKTLGLVNDALRALLSGLPVLLPDDADRENEADLVIAAQDATRAGVTPVTREGGGLITALRLTLRPMDSTYRSGVRAC